MSEALPKRLKVKGRGWSGGSGPKTDPAHLGLPRPWGLRRMYPVEHRIIRGGVKPRFNEGKQFNIWGENDRWFSSQRSDMSNIPCRERELEMGVTGRVLGGGLKGGRALWIGVWRVEGRKGLGECGAFKLLKSKDFSEESGAAEWFKTGTKIC